MDKKIFSVLAIGIILIIVIIFGGLIFLGNRKGQIFEQSNQSAQNIAFENGSEVKNKLADVYQDIKSFEFKGTIHTRSFNEDAKGIFHGFVITPLTIQITQDTENVSIYNNKLEFKTPKAKIYHEEVIAVDNHIFKKTLENGKWEFRDWIINPSEKGLKEKYPSYPTRPVPNVSWLTLNYADDLEYIDQGGSLYHYKIKPKSYLFGPAMEPIRNFRIYHGVNALPANLMETTISGEVWIDKDFNIIKEKYEIPYLNYGSDIEIDYKNYGKTFSIKAPIDTTSIDAEIDELINMSSGSIPVTIDSQSEDSPAIREARVKSQIANMKSYMASVQAQASLCRQGKGTIKSGNGGSDLLCSNQTGLFPKIFDCGKNPGDTKWTTFNGDNDNWTITINCASFNYCNGPSNAICDKVKCNFQGTCQ